MKHLVIAGLMLAFAPTVAVAQTAPAPAEAPARIEPTAQQQAAMRQFRAQYEQTRVLARTRLLAALTPQHRSAVASVVGQLALAANPDPRAAAQALDALLAPAEKQSILNIASAERANTRALMQQQRAMFASTLTADQKARMAQRAADRQAYRQSHPRTARVADPGAIVLRTLATFDVPGGHRGPGEGGGPGGPGGPEGPGARG